jgi:transposase
MSEPTPECPGCQALQAQVTALRTEVAGLRARLERNSSNSSRPPSSDPPWTPKPNRHQPTGKKRGGPPGHRRPCVALDQVDTRHEYLPTARAPCRAALPPDTPLEARVWVHQGVELPEVRPHGSEHVRRACRCPACGKRTWAPLPPGVPASGAGPRLHATVALLTGKGQRSRRPTREGLAELFQLPLAVGPLYPFLLSLPDRPPAEPREFHGAVRGGGSRAPS